MSTNRSFLNYSRSDGIDLTPYVQHAMICHKLQQSLKIDEILGDFFQYCNQLYNVCGLKFTCKNPPLNLLHGEIKEEKSIFHISIEDGLIGNLVFYKDSKFSDIEHDTIKNIMPIIVPPLNNAKTYLSTIEDSLLDQLTQVNNRKSLTQQLKIEISSVARSRAASSLMILDLDNFKSINDELGHIVGDEILIQFASILQKLARNSDIIFRYGGDEFIMMLRGASLKGASKVSERIIGSTNDLLKPYNSKLISGPPGSISIGLTQISSNDTEVSVLERADKALYKAKDAAGSSVQTL